MNPQEPPQALVLHATHKHRTAQCSVSSHISRTKYGFGEIEIAFATCVIEQLLPPTTDPISCKGTPLRLALELFRTAIAGAGGWRNELETFKSEATADGIELELNAKSYIWIALEIKAVNLPRKAWRYRFAREGEGMRLGQHMPGYTLQM